MSKDARSPVADPTKIVYPSKPLVTALIGDSRKSNERTGFLCAEIS